MRIFLDHEKLDAYRKALAFAAWSEPILDRVPKSSAVHGQLDRARTSIVLNIPEGNGRFTAADRCKFFDIARGSGLECDGCLEFFSSKSFFVRANSKMAKAVEGRGVSACWTHSKQFAG